MASCGLSEAIETNNLSIYYILASKHAISKSSDLVASNNRCACQSYRRMNCEHIVGHF